MFIGLFEESAGNQTTNISSFIKKRVKCENVDHAYDIGEAGDTRVNKETAAGPAAWGAHSLRRKKMHE